METKHTPGPWRLSKEYVFGPDKSVIATVFRELPSEEANALLIAAAPELLEIADLIFESILGGGRVVTFQDMHIEQLRAAIAKATGTK